MSLLDRVEATIVACPPAKRRRIAIHILLWSILAMTLNVVLYLTHVINESMLILVTLILSWLALTLTAADIVATTDVRDEIDGAD